MSRISDAYDLILMNVEIDESRWLYAGIEDRG
jgi:hypothetical protein